MYHVVQWYVINVGVATLHHELGLRGAVAFALAENLREYFPPEVTSYIVTTTLMIVLFTVLVLGGSTLPLLKVSSVLLLSNICGCGSGDCK